MYELTTFSSSSNRKVLFILCLIGLAYIISLSQTFLQVPISLMLETDKSNSSANLNLSTDLQNASVKQQAATKGPPEPTPLPKFQNSTAPSDAAIQPHLPHVTDLGPRARNGTAGSLWVTASLRGRLGNQMFIYASLIGIARTQNRYYFVESRTLLASLFKIHHARDGVQTSGWRCEKQAKYATYYESLMNLTQENVTLEGYFQSYRYFQRVENEVKEEFHFLKSIQLEVLRVLTKFVNRTTVGVHVRRTDFLRRSGCGVPNVSYFTKAFRKMRALLPGKNLTFLAASDDLDWCVQNLKDEDVAIAPPANASIHFALLASCDHVIVSGGTFGWWAAWLSRGFKIYYRGYIVKGSRLEAGFTSADYYPPKWIGMDD